MLYFCHVLRNSYIINGDTPANQNNLSKIKLSRQQYIDKFQSINGFNVIIMSPIAAGFGLNITEANHVIHYTRHWNPAKEQQATDRVYRIGQKREVSVYYPMGIEPNNEYKTFDLIIDELLERKNTLAEETLIPTEQKEIKREDFIDSLGFVNINSEEILIDSVDDLDKLNPLNFEAAIALLYEKKFGGNSYLTPISKDKGVDVVLFAERDENYLIQVKQSSNVVGENAGKEVHYAKAYYGERFGTDFKLAAVTNNFFTKSAIELANDNKVKLKDRDFLNFLISENKITLKEIENKRLSDRLKL